MFFRKIKNKIGKQISKKAPLNSLRIFGLRLCGCKVGKGVYIGDDLIIISSLSKNTEIEIGDRVSIAPRVTLILSSHPNNSKVVQFINIEEGKIIIENDAWIGTNVVIMPNIRIEEYAIIGAFSLVNSNIKKYSINYGIPTKRIKDILKKTN